MRSILFLMSFFLVSCSATEASSTWITNLLSAKNANYVADSAGTITMDGFTFTVAEVLGPFSAVYNIYIGEFDNRESSPFGYVRFELNSESLSDPRVLNPLSVSAVTSSIENAKTASLLGGAQIISVPNTVIDNRFLANVANLSYREFQTNGSTAEEVVAVSFDENSQFAYIQGIITTNGNDIFFQDVAFASRGVNTIFTGYFRTAHWKFIKALNDTQGIYQQVVIEKFVPEANFYNNGDVNYLFPRKATEPITFNPVYVGVEKVSNILYFHYPSATTFYSTADNVNFSSGVSVKVGRPLTPLDTAEL